MRVCFQCSLPLISFAMVDWILTRYSLSFEKLFDLLMQADHQEFSRLMYWLLALVCAQNGDVIAIGCLILLISGVHCCSYLACRIWSFALVASMSCNLPSVLRVATLFFVLWKPFLPPKKDKVKLYAELVLSVQNLGRAPLRSQDPERRAEDNLRQKIDKAKKTGGITERQYLTLTSAAKEDGHRFDVFKASVQRLGHPPMFNARHEGYEDHLRQQIEHAKKTGALSEEQYRALMQKRVQSDQASLTEQVVGLLSDLEAFKAKYGQYPTGDSWRPGIGLYRQRARVLGLDGLTLSQRTALENTQCYHYFWYAIKAFGRVPQITEHNDRLDETNLRRRIDRAAEAGRITHAHYDDLITFFNIKIRVWIVKRFLCRIIHRRNIIEAEESGTNSFQYLLHTVLNLGSNAAGSTLMRRIIEGAEVGHITRDQCDFLIIFFVSFTAEDGGIYLWTVIRLLHQLANRDSERHLWVRILESVQAGGITHEQCDTLIDLMYAP